MKSFVQIPFKIILIDKFVLRCAVYFGYLLQFILINFNYLDKQVVLFVSNRSHLTQLVIL